MALMMFFISLVTVPLLAQCIFCCINKIRGKDNSSDRLDEFLLKFLFSAFFFVVQQLNIPLAVFWIEYFIG
jgi:ABC-type Co2+ transport system permease subunit